MDQASNQQPMRDPTKIYRLPLNDIQLDYSEYDLEQEIATLRN